MKKLFLILIILTAALSTYAAHIIGGSISYVCLGNGEYEFTLFIYRDCNGGGADFDDPAPISVYDSLENLISNPQVTLISDTLVPLNDPGPLIQQ